MKFTAAAAVAAMAASANAIAMPAPIKNAKQFANDIHYEAQQFAVAHQNDAAFRQQNNWVQPDYCGNYPPLGQSYTCGGFERAYGNYLCQSGYLQYCGDSGVNCDPYAPRPRRWQDPDYYNSIYQCYINPVNCYGAQSIDPYTGCVNRGGIQTCKLDDNGNTVCVA